MATCNPCTRRVLRMCRRIGCAHYTDCLGPVSGHPLCQAHGGVNTAACTQVPTHVGARAVCGEWRRRYDALLAASNRNACTYLQQHKKYNLRRYARGAQLIARTCRPSARCVDSERATTPCYLPFKHVVRTPDGQTWCDPPARAVVLLDGGRWHLRSAVGVAQCMQGNRT
jgi:hypothetical protein